MGRQHIPILVVEDSPLVNKALCDYFGTSRLPAFEVFSAATLAGARRILETHPIHFIILDLELPDGTGEELIGYLGASELYIHTKVIVLTGSLDKTRRDQLFQLGIIDYLSKDNPINFLSNEIKKSINQFQAHEHTRILVVDDSKFFADHVASILRNQNYTVDVCLDSTVVYRFLREHPVNLLITDLEMPEMNGIELLHQIRNDDSLIDLPIIGVSGTTNQDLVSRLLKSGANDFLAKPFLIETLLLKVDVTVSLYKKQRKLSELNAYLQEEVRYSVEAIRSKDQLLELDNRHAQMGQLIEALTHQWKQPLYGITLAAGYIRQRVSDDPEVAETLDTIREQVDFLTETMHSFRHFFKTAETMEPFSVVEAFNEIRKLLGETYDMIRCTVEGDPNIVLMGYPNEFYQVIINLMNNAQDAFRERHTETPEIHVRVRRSATDVVITVCDNAGGVPGEIIETVFNQYVSTKSQNGTGIGLHLSQLVIRKIGGTITVANEPEGACFTITLPLTACTLLSGRTE